MHCLSPNEKRRLQSQEQCCLCPIDLLGCCCFAKEGERPPSAFCFLPLRASTPSASDP